MSKKNTLPINIQKLKVQLDLGNNLMDYFIVIGIPPSEIINRTSLFNLNNFQNYKTILKNFCQSYKPKIISKFPKFDKNINTIDESIINYIFPNGIKPKYSEHREKILQEEIKYFIIDNGLYSREYPQKYLTCLIFYEDMYQYYSLYEDIQKTKNFLEMNENNNSEDIINNSNNSDEFSTFTSYGHLKTISSDASILNENKNILSTKSTITSNQNKHTHKLKHFYIPKCICIVSIHPYINLFKEILVSIYKYSKHPQQIPLEKIITNLIIEIPIPPRGLYSIEFNIINKRKILKREENNRLLLCELDLRTFHKCIKFNIIKSILLHLLFDSKIILFSKNLNYLYKSILPFLYLIFPFKYPFQVNSYLMKNEYNILESISPYFIGINEKYNSQFFEEKEISVTEDMNVLLVDLDNNESKLITNEEFPDFPKKIINDLEKELKNLDENNHMKETVEEFNKNYQEIYFDFFCLLIKNYENYLNINYYKKTEDDVTSIETLFNCNKFVNSHSSDDISFYNKLVNGSQMFSNFIIQRMLPQNNNELIEILLVNDNIIKIKNKNKMFKEETSFLNSSQYKHINKYDAPQTKILTEKEKNFIKENIEQLNKKGQIVKFKSTIQKENILLFKYNLFPELDFDIYFNNESVNNEYFLPPNYSEEIERINIDIITESSLGKNINRSLEMKNQLFLCWLEVWAFTFWYMTEEERYYRFNQMIDILDKVIQHDRDILNMLFDTLNTCKQNDMILKLYKKLFHLNIYPNSFIWNIVEDLIKNEKTNKLKDKNKTNNNKEDYKFNLKNYNIKKRTFLSLEDELALDTKIKFYSEYLCIECGEEKINLLNVCRTFENVNNDIFWVYCNKCEKYILPQIKVRFGTEFLRDKSFKTSSFDQFAIHSPYYLKIYIKDAVMNNYETKLNVLDFKIKSKSNFWTFIWYCQIHNLPYDIILPYSEDIEKLNKIKYENSSTDIFEIIYEDKLYKDNLKKISKYSNIIYEKYKNSQKDTINLDKYKIEKINDFEFIKIKKQKKILKNIDINEDEDEYEEEENEENQLNNKEQIIINENPNKKNNIIKDKLKKEEEKNNILEKENKEEEFKEKTEDIKDKEIKPEIEEYKEGEKEKNIENTI